MVEQDIHNLLVLVHIIYSVSCVHRSYGGVVRARDGGDSLAKGV